MEPFHSENPPRLAHVAAAWITPFVAAALAFGSVLVVRNATNGIPWMSPAIFCGAPAAVMGAVGAGLGILLYLILKFAAPHANRLPVHAAIAAFAGGSLGGYHCIREFSVETEWRWATGILSGALLATASVYLLKSRATAWISKFVLACGFIVFLLFGVVVIQRILASAAPAPVAQAASDPRDAVTQFPPLENPPKVADGAGRVLLLGIDGATWDKIDPLIAAGRLPHFEKLRKGGATTRLATIIPTASPLIWTTIATGLPPSDHGIQDFIVRRTRFLPNYSLELQNRPMRALLSLLDLYVVVPVTSNLRTSKAIWNITTELKIKTCVVGWWASFPAEPIDGWLVSDATSQEWVKRLMGKNEQLEKRALGTTHPEELAGELAPLHRSVESITKEELAKFIKLDDTAWSDFQKATEIDRDNPLSILHSSLLRDEFFVTSALKIDTDHKPGMLFCYTRLTDDIGHFFWEYSEDEARELGRDPKLIERYRDTVNKSYEWADGIVGRFMERLGPNDVLVVLSDHGWERASRGMYNHNGGPDGILAFYGAGVKPGYVLKEKPHVLDVGPTLLYLAGIPEGDDMPGHALRDAFTITRAERTVPTWETTRKRGSGMADMLGSEQRMRELEGLGYVSKKK